MSHQEQSLFQQLAIFRGGFTPEAVAAVCRDRDALDLIESFINKSLIIKGREVYQTPRFGMLKLIRDFGLEQLQKNPEKDIYYFNYASYFASFVGR